MNFTDNGRFLWNSDPMDWESFYRKKNIPSHIWLNEKKPDEIYGSIFQGLDHHEIFGVYGFLKFREKHNKNSSIIDINNFARFTLRPKCVHSGQDWEYDMSALDKARYCIYEKLSLMFRYKKTPFDIYAVENIGGMLIVFPYFKMQYKHTMEFDDLPDIYFEESWSIEYKEDKGYIYNTNAIFGINKDCEVIHMYTQEVANTHGLSRLSFRKVDDIMSYQKLVQNYK